MEYFQPKKSKKMKNQEVQKELEELKVTVANDRSRHVSERQEDLKEVEDLRY